MKAIALAIGIATVVLAAGTPVRADPSSGFAGGYVGVNAGVARGSSNFGTDPGCVPVGANGTFCEQSSTSSVNGTHVARSGSGDLSDSGFTGGIQGGYNWQSGSIVFGGEADFGALDLGKSIDRAGVFPFPFLGTTYALGESMSTDWLVTLRGKLGYVAAPQLLLYATAGVAFTELDFSSSYSDNAVDVTFPGGAGSGSSSDVLTGWTVGGGGEWKLDERWSIKAEYLYLDFGSMTVAVPVSNTVAFAQTMRVDADLDIHLARIGLNYRY